MLKTSDILKIEYFLIPRTLIAGDGRTGDARFLAANLQCRRWYHHDANSDVRNLEFRESPRGR